MDVGGVVSLVVTVFFGGAAFVYAGYTLEANRRIIALFSYTFGTACMVAAIILAGLRIAWPASIPPVFSSAKMPTILVFSLIVVVVGLAVITQLEVSRRRSLSGLAQDAESSGPISNRSSPFPDVLVKQINFDYLPDSPLNHGWTVAYNSPGPGAKWLVPVDASSSGSIAIEMEDLGCAIDFRVDPNAALCDRLTCDAKLSDGTALFFLSVQLANRSGAQTTKFIKYVLGTDKPSPTPGYADSEWTLPIKPLPLPGGWRRLDITFAESVAQTWGAFGWSFRSLVAIRLRGRISVSPISLFSRIAELPEAKQSGV